MSRTLNFSKCLSKLILCSSIIFLANAIQAATLSGSIKDKSGAAIVGANAQLFMVESGSLVQVESIIKVGDDGIYSWNVDDGSYVIRAYFNSGDVSLVGAPNSALVQSEDFEVVGDTVKDTVMTFFMLSGNVVDENNLPIAGVDIQTNKAWSGPAQGGQGFLSQFSINHSNQSSTTSDTGEYALLLFSTDSCISSGFFTDPLDCHYDLSFVPPAVSGFAENSQHDYLVNGDSNLDLELVIDDQTPAKNVVSPYVRYLTDNTATIEWMTDEATTGSVEIANVGIFVSDNLRTFHSVAVTGLVASSEYTAEVVSTDRQGNLSNTASLAFTTSNQPDSQPPAYLQVLQLAAISSEQVTVEFCANEPVTATISVGATNYQLDELASCQRLTVSDLAANQSYNLVASITDSAGNGPVLSPVLQATTLPAFDWNSPVIISGPTVTDVSDSNALVVWTTNEPTTSDLSYNDGVQYQIVKDSELTSKHSVLLTNLSADTSYQLAVSAKDSSGNGPTVSHQVEFTTQQTPDTNSPQIIGRPMIQGVTDDSAIISWRTDESASSKVLLGTTATNLNRIEAGRVFTQQHQLAVTTLVANTTYFYQVQSVDLSGNISSSAIAQFTTFDRYDGSELKIVSGPIIERLTGNSISLSWSTNQSSDSRLVCQSSNGSSEVNRLDLVKNHLITLTGLQFNTAYRCVVYSTDLNGQIVSAVQSAVSTEDVDTTPPQCESAATVEAYSTYVDLTWQATELASANVNYRIKGEQNWSSESSDQTDTAGYVRLDSLLPDTVYEQQVVLTDLVGNTGECSVAEFTTDSNAVITVPSFTLQPVVSDIGSYSANVEWQTDVLSNGIVSYGLSENSLSFIESTPEYLTSHELVLSGLQPETTYYLQVEASNTNGDFNLSEIISFTTLALPDSEVLPPKIITGPFVTNITDVTAIVEWQTDKEANSQVSIINGDTFINQALTTSHSVLLTNLTASTDYASLVTSTDQFNNQSDSKPADFRTLDLADDTLPKFVSGPSAIAIDFDRFTLTFCANEPVSAVVMVDATEYLLNGAKLCHQLEVTELTANTTYTVVVEITDVAGNGPVISSPLAVTTLVELDVEPPQITGPSVTDITDSSAIVRWTTNEYASSGVNYTDGVTNNQLQDTTLVTEHVTYLNNLTAATRYSLTVNSSDAFGNYSESQTVEFTTLSLPDSEAPNLISGPFVEDITSNSAFVIWTTNEASSHLVTVGQDQNNLDLLFTLDGLSNDHQVPLSDLQADTLYYFQVSSTDLADNTFTSAVHSFRTLEQTEQPVILQITAGPDIESVTTNSLSISWSTNLNSDSRLVCQAQQSFNGASAPVNSFENSLAKVNRVAADRAIKDQYIVLLKDQDPLTNNLSYSKLTKTQRVDKLQQVSFEIASKVSAKVVRRFNHKVNGFVLTMSANKVAELRSDQRILMIEQDQWMSVSVTQNNPTWGLDRIDQADLPLSNSYTYEPDGTGVSTYIIDTGVLTSHADFNGRANSGWDFVDNDSDASDCHGHGTHVAGTVASSTWGVAKNASVTAIRVLGCNGSGSNSGVIAGVDWVAENASLPAVANMSLGGGDSAILDMAVNRAIDAGITFVVAAGNSNINACSGSPNKVPAAITVASSTSSDTRSSFSNWGACVDIFAPGSDITSTWSNGGVNSISGTSMAAPHVAGAAALFLQAYPNSSPAEVDAGLTAFATENKITNPNGSPNLLLNVEFEEGTVLPELPDDPEPERITFEVSSDEMVKQHLLTLTGLDSNTIYSCRVHSADIERNKVSADIRGTTLDIPDVTPPSCTNDVEVSAFVDSALFSWQSDEPVTAEVNYRMAGEVDWLQQSTLSLAKNDSLLVNSLLAETNYEHQVTLIDASGNRSDCNSGNFETLAPEGTPEAVFSIQPVVSDIQQHSAVISWQTEQPSSANVRYGKVRTALDKNQSDDLLLSSHQVELHSLQANTTYYLQVDAFNILGEITSSQIVNFTTLHPEADFDQDGIPNSQDNCPLTENPDQADSDGNGVGDVCDEVIAPDTDFDDDGIADDIDNCPADPNNDQLDQDNDGIGDVCDAPVGSDNDFDDDNILDDVDNCPLIANPQQLDSDNNGIGDLCDIPIIISPPPVEPSGLNLRGNVTAEGTPIAGVVIALYDAQQAYISSVTTEADGNYLFEFLLPGSYFVGVTPPAETGFSSLPLQPINLVDRDVVHLISLISDGIRLSGFVIDSQARVIDNIEISLHQQTNGVQVGNSILTDENGYFEFFVAPGNYKLKPKIDVFNPSQSEFVVPNYAVPDFATVIHSPQNIQLTDDLELEVVLPFALLSGQTLDPLGNPVAGVAISIQHQHSTFEAGYYLDNYATNSQSNGISDSNGQFEFAVFTDQQFDMQLSPPASRLDLAVTTISDVILNGDLNDNFSLQQGVSLSGVLTDTLGRAIDHTKITLHHQQSGAQIGLPVFTDENGQYLFNVVDGSYKLKPHLNPFGESEGLRPSYPLPDYATVIFAQQNVEVNGATVQNIELPMAILSGTIANANGDPIPSARVTISHIADAEVANQQVSYFLESQGKSLQTNAKSDSNGEFSIALFTDQPMNITFVPPASERQVAATNYFDYSIAVDTAQTFVMQQSLLLSGYLRDAQGTAVDSTLITVHNQSDNQLADVATLTNAEGYFQFKVASGDYKLRPYLQTENQVNNQSITSEYPVPDFAAVYYLAKDISVTSDTEVDLNLPMSILSGKTIDANGVAVAGVKLKSDHSLALDSVSYYLENTGELAGSRAISDENGEFAFALFNEQVIDISVNPPVESGFAITSVSHNLDQETSENIYLPHVDSPPKIIYGPEVIRIGERSAIVVWRTDKPARGIIELSNGRTINVDRLTTYNCILIWDLEPSTQYTVTVQAVDKDEQTSDTKSTEFQTKGSASIKPPEFVSGPTVSNITENQFEISFCANGPVTATINIDSEGLDSEQFLLESLDVCHRIVIDTREPNTEYLFRVSILDPQGNGPTDSQPQDVTTLPLADITAPEIMLLPYVIDITDTAARVIWKTDEESNSGVSYNNGNQYHVVTESELVLDHNIQLTDLLPETLYSLTVSSTDGHGNGPTLSQAIQFTTLAAPDTAAPVLIGSPLIQNITHQNVVIRWRTDEASTTAVEFGTDENQLSEIETNGESLKTSHNMAITGLQADTVYFFRVRSQDAAGNVLTSEVLSFRTKVRGHQGAPHFMSDVVVEQTTSNSVTVAWRTDVNADGRLVCRLGDSASLQKSHAKRTKNHRITLTGLQSNSSYQCIVHSTDHKGYSASFEIDANVVTPATQSEVLANSSSKSAAELFYSFIGSLTGDQNNTRQERQTKLAPEITQVLSIDAYGETALVSLGTNELTSILLQYREQGESRWHQLASLEVSASHQMLLPKLTPNSSYQLQYSVTNLVGETTISSISEFDSGSINNLELPAFVSSTVISDISENTALVSFQSNDFAFAQVNIGRTPSELLQKEANAELTTNHSVSLVRIEPATIYYLQVTLFNLAGEAVTSEVVSFVTSALSATDDSDADGMTDQWEISHGLDPQDASDSGLDQDGDGLTNREEFLAGSDPNNSDSDSDGIPDGWEVDHGLDPNDASDADQDRDGDGQSNRDEYLNSNDNQAPVIELSEELTIDSSGVLTAVPNNDIVATDNIDGDVVVALVGETHRLSGLHMIDWVAEDAAGNRTVATQRLKIRPQVLLADGVSTGENKIVEIPVKLSGDAADYPVVIPFSLAGDVDAEDYQLLASAAENYQVEGEQLVIYQGHSGVIRIEILEDSNSETDEQLLINLATPENAILVGNSQYQIIITGANLAPKANLKAMQVNQLRTTVTRDGGPVTIEVAVQDGNSVDTHQVEWESADNAQISIDSETNALSLDPAALALGIYSKTVTVTDDGQPNLSHSKTIYLNVIETAPNLSAANDSDGDGINDLEEGLQDSDLDGVPNYLDPLNLVNVLQQQPSAQHAIGNYVMQVDAGLNLALGNIALANQSGSLISQQDLQSSEAFLTHGDDSNYNQIGGLSDFVVSGLQAEGDSVRVVIPQQQAIPEEAVYRKLHTSNGWFSFVIDTNNQLYSSPGSQGACPSPSDDSYVEGLNAGDWCVLMLIEDGGPNDVDDSINARIVDPGGVSSPLALSTVSIAAVSNVVEGDNITLNATVVDNGNQVISYQWQQTAGASVTILNSDQLAASVNNIAQGSYTFSLTITDDLGRTSTDQVSVTVAAKTNPPVAEESSGGGGGSLHLAWLLLLGLLSVSRMRVKRD
jgi:subtilisin family serine protease/chitodextrinase